MTKLPRLLALVLPIIFTSNALGWGSYGHEQVNAAALDLLPPGQIKHCFSQKNRNTLIRYAITPDADWKMLPYESRALKLRNLFENPKSRFSQETLKDELDREEEAVKRAQETNPEAPINKNLRPGLLENLRKDPTNTELLAQLKEDLSRFMLLDVYSTNTLSSKRTVDRTEHSLHYWEADAFTKDVSSQSVLDLANDRNFFGVHKFSQDNGYDDHIKAFTERRRDNGDRIKAIDPKKAEESDLNNPSSRDVIQQGSAPWRIVQLYKQGIEELKVAKRLKTSNKSAATEHFKKALLALGSMGHYVGDMSQPFHSSLNYDGQGSTPSQEGIHSNFETKILDEEAEVQGKPPQDKKTGLWPDLSATHGTVLKFASDINPPDFIKKEPKHVVREIMYMVAESYDLVDELLALHDQARRQAETLKAQAVAEREEVQKKLDEEAKTNGKKPKRAPLRDTPSEHQIFRTLTLKSKHSVVEIAQKRISQSAILLARLWYAALNKAGMKEKELASFCPEVAFDRDYAIAKYPVPNYHSPADDFNRFPPREKSENSSKNSEEK